MKSTKVTGFFSCSFADKDKDVISLFRAICDGLDIHCSNVSDGYKETPADKARQLIDETQLFIAVATCRTEVSPGLHQMPDAVHDEIAMAYGKKKPMLLFKESGVDFSKGFLQNYGTYVQFSRSDLQNPEFLRRAITSIHTLKLDVISSNDLAPEQESSSFYAETMEALYELKKTEDAFTWAYSINRKLVFTDSFKGQLKLGAWTTLGPGDVTNTHRIKWEVVLERGSKSFKLLPSTDRDTSQCVEISLKVEPKPEKGDSLEFSQYFESPHLNRIFLPSDGELERYSVGDNKYHCFDGVVPIMRVKQLRGQFRFPREYGLKKENLRTMVGSYSAGVDYLVESEIKRCNWDIREFGGNLTIDFDIESPLMRHVYGIAWSIPDHQRRASKPV